MTTFLMVHLTSSQLHYQMVDLEKQFHNYFFVGIYEMKITYLTRLKQSNDENN
jgi:hypothetical protein